MAYQPKRKVISPSGCSTCSVPSPYVIFFLFFFFLLLHSSEKFLLLVTIPFFLNTALILSVLLALSFPFVISLCLYILSTSNGLFSWPILGPWYKVGLGTFLKTSSFSSHLCILMQTTTAKDFVSQRTCY